MRPEAPWRTESQTAWSPGHRRGLPADSFVHGPVPFPRKHSQQRMRKAFSLGWSITGAIERQKKESCCAGKGGCIFRSQLQLGNVMASRPPRMMKIGRRANETVDSLSEALWSAAPPLCITHKFAHRTHERGRRTERCHPEPAKEPHQAIPAFFSVGTRSELTAHRAVLSASRTVNGRITLAGVA